VTCDVRTNQACKECNVGCCFLNGFERRSATAHGRLFLELFFGGWQNIKKREVFAAAHQDAGPFFFYLFFIFSLLF